MFKRGDQIRYRPDHVPKDIDEHPDIELGFVTSVRDEIAFCRYWARPYSNILRTTANSEATRFENLEHFASRPAYIIDNIMKQIELDILVAA